MCHLYWQKLVRGHHFSRANTGNEGWVSVTGYFSRAKSEKCNHILSKPHLLWIPKSFAQLTVYTSSGLRHPHNINSRIQARFLHNFMAAWIPIGLCMNKFWLALPHSWSRAINALYKIYFHTCTEVGKENVWKCQGDVTCHGDGNSYVGQLSQPQHSTHMYSEMKPCLQKCWYQHIKLRIMHFFFVYGNKIQDYRDICCTVWAQVWELLKYYHNVQLPHAGIKKHLNLWIKFKLHPNPDHLSATCLKADKAMKQSVSSSLFEKRKVVF